MPDSNRGIYATLAGLILGLGAPLCAQEAGNTGSNNASAAERTDTANDSPPIAAALDRLANEVAETREEQADPYGDERNERERRDVIAQESMAFWAKAMFWAIIAQTLLALGALVALILDLRLNRKSAERQIRSYILIEEISGTLDGFGETARMVIRVRFKNSGASFADLFERMFDVNYATMSEDGKPITDLGGRAINKRVIEIGPGATFETEEDFPLNLLRMVGAFVITVGYRYRDEFSSRRERAIQYFVNPPRQNPMGMIELPFLSFGVVDYPKGRS